MLAIEESGLLSALKRPTEDYMFYVENDENPAKDSTLIYNIKTKRFSTFVLFPGGYMEYQLSLNDLSYFAVKSYCS